MNRFRTAALLMVLVSMSAMALDQGSPVPSLTTTPSPPVAGQPFVVNAAFLGAEDTAKFAFFFAIEDEILISGYPEFPLVYGHVRLTVPAMQAGNYNVSFISYGFSPQPQYASFPIVIAPQGTAPAPVPAFSIAGISGCAFALILMGIAVLRRREADQREELLVVLKKPSRWMVLNRKY